MSSVSCFVINSNDDITITRNGHLYYGPEADAGIAGFSGSIQAGWIDQGSTPSACQIDQFVHGWSLTGNGYVPEAGVPGLAGIGPAVGETWGNEGGTSVNDFGTNVGIGFGAGRQLGSIRAIASVLRLTCRGGEDVSSDRGLGIVTAGIALGAMSVIIGVPTARGFG